MTDHDLVEKALQLFRDKTIVVVGDLMIDRYVWGRVSRISPEAPVPVVEVESDADRPGGAANVVLNILSLGAKCRPIGVVGEDLNGAALKALLTEKGASVDGIVTDPGRPTTVKTRVIAGTQHIVRVDRERTHPISNDVEKLLRDRYTSSIDGADAVILEDYNKGVMTTGLIHQAIRAARSTSIPVTVDPKVSNFFDYKGVTVFKPNLREASAALNRNLESETDVNRAGNELLSRLETKTVMITRGSKGMSLYHTGRQPVHIPTRARSVADVSGAGDTVIATLTLGLAVGLDTIEAARLANYAAGYVVGQAGVVPVTPEALEAETRD